MNDSRTRRRANRQSRKEKIALLIFELRSHGVPAAEMERFAKASFAHREACLRGLRELKSRYIR